MSSSETLEGIELRDLQTEAPAAPTREEFAEIRDFEHMSTAPVPLPSREEAFRDGFAEGEMVGRQAALKELEPVIAELRTLAAALGSVRVQRLAEAESDLIDVACEVTRRILHGELAQDGDTVVRLARACVREAADDGPLVVRAAAEDLDLLRTHAPDLEVDLAEGEIRIEPDPSVERGGVVVESRRRCYDGRPERILRDVAERLGEETP